MRRPYYLIRRGEFWYSRLNRESGLVNSDGVTWHTTGCKDRGDAENFVKDLLAADRYPDVPAKTCRFASTQPYSTTGSAAPMYAGCVRRERASPGATPRSSVSG